MKELLKSPVGIVISFFILLFLYSSFGPKIPFSLVTQQKGEPFMVTEEGTATAIPDIVKVSLGIEESGSSLKTIQDNVNKKSKTLVSELKRFGIDEKDIKTTAYNVYPEYNYELRPVRINGYRVSVSYELTLEDFDKVNELLTKATEIGVNSIGSISFELKEETKNKALEEAREKAAEKAKDKAKSLAKVAGISLGKIINISESSNYDNIKPMYPTREAVGLGGDLNLSIAQPEITPGETEISVSLSISWEIK